MVRYPFDKSRRFRCGVNSDICIDDHLICDGVADCDPGTNSSDDEIICPWQNAQSTQRRFTCENGTEIDQLQRCDTVPDCAKGEDEYYCFIGDPQILYSYDAMRFTQLEDILVYPPVSDQRLFRPENPRFMQDLPTKMGQ